MKRRSFLGFLGGAAVGGKSVAVKAIEDATALNIGHVAYATGASLSMNATGMISGGGMDPTYKASRIAELMRMISRFSKAKHVLIEEARKEQFEPAYRLDPNLHALRSVALQHKVRIQTDADLWRQVQRNKSWIERELDQLTGGA